MIKLKGKQTLEPIINRVSTTELGKSHQKRSNLEKMRAELNRFKQVQYEVQRRREILNKVKERGRCLNDLELECMFENEELTESLEDDTISTHPTITVKSLHPTKQSMTSVMNICETPPKVYPPKMEARTNNLF